MREGLPATPPPVLWLWPDLLPISLACPGDPSLRGAKVPEVLGSSVTPSGDRDPDQSRISERGPILLRCGRPHHPGLK